MTLRSQYHAVADKAPRLHPLIERLFSNPMIRVTDATRHLDVTYPTARAENVYPKAFYAREIFNAAYAEEQ